MRRRWIAVALVLAAALAAPAAARAADPGRWTLTGTTSLPIVYYQGVTVDAARNLFFDGVYVGLYRTTPAFTETGRNDDVIPPDVSLRERYNHIGDIAWDRREGGRILLPMECYYPGQANGGNPCLHGSIGVADPGTLEWRYYVKLDPAEIPKAMWNEVSPDGSLLWTSSGNDLLAYRTADISQANAAPAHPPIRSVRRLPGAVPPSGITGATFVGGRLFVAGQDGPTVPGGAIDLATGQRRRESGRRLVGGAEGGRAPALEGGAPHRGGVRGARDRVAEGRHAALADPAVQHGEAAADLRRRPRDPAELPARGGRPGAVGTGRLRFQEAVGAAAAALARDGAAPPRLRGGGALPERLHGQAARAPGWSRARPLDEARAAGRPALGAEARAAHRARPACPARAPRAAAPDPPGDAARAVGPSHAADRAGAAALRWPPTAGSSPPSSPAGRSARSRGGWSRRPCRTTRRRGRGRRSPSTSSAPSPSATSSRGSRSGCRSRSTAGRSSARASAAR